MTIDDLQVYSESMILADDAWRIVSRWDRFERETIGKQLVRAADSVGANIAEGYGRYHYGEKRQFCYYARGSLFEFKAWIEKAAARGLLGEEELETSRGRAERLGKLLNGYVRSLRKAKPRADTQFPIPDSQ